MPSCLPRGPSSAPVADPPFTHEELSLLAEQAEWLQWILRTAAEIDAAAAKAAAEREFHSWCIDTSNDITLRDCGVPDTAVTNDPDDI